MAQRRFHYEQAFEHYLRANRIPYVAVDEAKKTLVPRDRRLSSLKSFDFVVYGVNENLLIDIKGRKCGRSVTSRRSNALRTGRLDSWVTVDDVDSLTEWRRLFGEGFRAVFVFAYWLDAQPPDVLFQEILEFRSRWYALRCVNLEEYRRCMRVRSERWRTVHVPTETFARISHPMSADRLVGRVNPENQTDDNHPRIQ